MRVAYIIDSLRVGGKERQTVELLKGLAFHDQLSVLLICMGPESFFEPQLANTSVRIHRLLRHRRWDVGMFARLYGVLNDFRPDIIHTTCWMTSLYGLPLARWLHVKMVNGSIRNAFARRTLRWRVERLLLKLSDARLANSKAGLLSRGFSPKGGGNHVVHNGFDFARTADKGSGVKQQVLDSFKGRKIVGMVAQFKDDKDYETYFEAARLLLGKRKDVVFLAVGDGKNFQDFRRRFGTVGGIEFLGRQQAVEAVISTFDVGVLATFTEGIPNCVMECMALGKPVVVTDGGGSSELVLNGVTGFLVPPRDPVSLEERIAYCLDHPEEAIQLGRAGHIRLANVFSIGQLIEGTLSVYRKTLAVEAEFQACTATTNRAGGAVDMG